MAALILSISSGIGGKDISMESKRPDFMADSTNQSIDEMICFRISGMSSRDFHREVVRRQRTVPDRRS
jgi:hypothetical protein